MKIRFRIVHIMGLVALAAVALAAARRVRPLDILALGLGFLIALRIMQMSSDRPRPGGAP